MTVSWSKHADLTLSGSPFTGLVFAIEEIGDNTVFATSTGIYYVATATLVAGGSVALTASSIPNPKQVWHPIFGWTDQTLGALVFQCLAKDGTRLYSGYSNNVGVIYSDDDGVSFTAMDVPQWDWRAEGCRWIKVVSGGVYRGYGAGWSGVNVYPVPESYMMYMGDSISGGPIAGTVQDGTLIVFNPLGYKYSGPLLAGTPATMTLTNPDHTGPTNPTYTKMVEWGDGSYIVGFQTSASKTVIVGPSGTIVTIDADAPRSMLGTTITDALGVNLAAAGDIYYSADGGATWALEQDFNDLTVGDVTPVTSELFSLSDGKIYVVGADTNLNGAKRVYVSSRSAAPPAPPAPLPTPIPLGSDSTDGGQMTVRWDNDRTGWKDERHVSLGDVGDTYLVHRLRRLGIYRTRQWELVCASPVVQCVVSMEEDAEVFR